MGIMNINKIHSSSTFADSFVFFDFARQGDKTLKPPKIHHLFLIFMFRDFASY